MSIRVKTLKQAVAEARRFIEAAEVVERAAGHSTFSRGINDPWYNGGSLCAAAKRSSMDLSRALAGVRRGGG